MRVMAAGSEIRFASPWDRTLRIATALLVGLLCLIGLGELALGAYLARGSLALMYPFLIAPLALGGTILGAWLLAPRAFVLNGSALHIERPLRSLEIPLLDVRAVAALPEGIGFAIRAGGNGGLFGYYGRFWSRSLGSFRLYATRRKDLVRVATASEVFVLSPDRSAEFVRELLARAPQAEHSAIANRRVGRGSALPALRMVGLIFAAIACLVAGLFAFIWGFAPVSVETAQDVVRIERRWASAVELPLAQIRDVEVLAPQYGRRWWRTNGTAMGAIRYGRFASRELGEFSLYAWRYGPYVLIQTERERVVLTPDAPERFVVDLSRRIGSGARGLGGSRPIGP